ncbi:conserved hypothetical protein [Ricinus communis]|uniref:Uncharacterized protein n=1 Tax=Ricinus communis TaxID=3988 RepID=B9RMX2_RICCO|nr:conserved hypothetical protein [Ricinus communis]
MLHLLKKEPRDSVCHSFLLETGFRSNRTPKAEFWKPTGKPLNVIGCLNPVRTKWIMHECDITAKSNSGIKAIKLEHDSSVMSHDVKLNHYRLVYEKDNLSWGIKIQSS